MSSSTDSMGYLCPRSQNRFLSTTALRISLENPTAHYEPGDVIIGEIVLTNEKPKEFKSIKIHIEPKITGDMRRAATHIAIYTYYHSDDEDLNSDDECDPSGWVTYFKATHECFSQKVILLKNNANKTLLKLPPGTHRYPFSYNLPASIPPTSKNDLGRMECSIKAIIKRPWYKLNFTQVKPFTIQGQLELNHEPRVNCNISKKSKYPLAGDKLIVSRGY